MVGAVLQKADTILPRRSRHPPPYRDQTDYVPLASTKEYASRDRSTSNHCEAEYYG